MRENLLKYLFLTEIFLLTTKLEFIIIHVKSGRNCQNKCHQKFRSQKLNRYLKYDLSVLKIQIRIILVLTAIKLRVNESCIKKFQ